jgi:U3 small nucleolar RNA-associated protein 10
MTSLTAQLSAIAAGADPRLSLPASHAIASYIYSSRQAAQQSLDDVHARAHNSFLVLASQNQQFGKFEPVFFGERAKSTDRTLLSPPEATELDENISRLLSALAPYALVRDSGFVIEWLIRRFRCALF